MTPADTPFANTPLPFLLVQNIVWFFPMYLVKFAMKATVIKYVFDIFLSAY
jgi:hypothetical protein